MSTRPQMVRLLCAALAVITLSVACRATPEVTAISAGDPTALQPVQDEAASLETSVDSDGASEPAVTFTYDPRIDLRLVRDDIDCRVDALTPYDNTRVVTAHYVVDGQLGDRCFGQENPLLLDAWILLVSSAPADHLQQMGVFVGYVNILDIPSQASPLGIASSLGWQSGGAQISVDLDHAFTDANRLLYVLIHEMGHVLSGARSQTTPINTPAECGAFYYSYSCFRADALFTEFAALFWLDYLPTIDPNTRPSAEKGRRRCERDGGFLNAYAASDPFEDFAESYAVFVQGIQVATPGLQAKVDWFARQPALASARDRAVLLRPRAGWQMPQQCG